MRTTRLNLSLSDRLKSHFSRIKYVPERDPFQIKTYSELVKIVAELAYYNADYLLFFRGQTKDHRDNKNQSTFLPSIYREGNFNNRRLSTRFSELDAASTLLKQYFQRNKTIGVKDIARRQLLQWSILQHYEVCATPLLDFTQSLRVACSFATNSNSSPEAFIFVFALPQMSNRISINSEHELINIRLLSICPPSAIRPYFQEGFLAGTEDVTTNFDDLNELDFKNRLVAKFVIPNSVSFWESGFAQIPEEALLPTNDPILEICRRIKDDVTTTYSEGDIGTFLLRWAELEQHLFVIQSPKSYPNRNIRNVIRKLYHSEKISLEQFQIIDRMREFRNVLVHTPKNIRSADLHDFNEMVTRLLHEIKTSIKTR